MTPAARYSAAISVLDQVLAGDPAEKALIDWGRKNRYAGSKDRAAVRDHVYEALRKKRSSAAYGGGEDGRSLMIGLLRQNGYNLSEVFNGVGYAPTVLSAAEASFVPSELSESERHDLPDWIWQRWCDALGDDASTAAMTQRERANVALRVNPVRGSVADAVASLKQDAIETIAHEFAPQCLIVTSNHRRVGQSKAYSSGLVEIQDASSQMAVQSWPVNAGDRVLDYCAGGGGKALALACHHGAQVTAHDVYAKRTADIPVRAKRAGVVIPVVRTAQLANCDKFDVVVCDAPCSGSGTWRRSPDAKWNLTQSDLTAFQVTQIDALRAAGDLVAQGGFLIYSTCSVMREENQTVISQFQQLNPGTEVVTEKLISPKSLNDGFYYCVLKL